jgi:hypothetical protein
MQPSEFSVPVDVINKVTAERRQERVRGFRKAIEIAMGERGYQKINSLFKLYSMLNSATDNKLAEMTKNFAEALSGLGINYSLETDEFIDGVVFGCKKILEESKEFREEAEKQSETYLPYLSEEDKRIVLESRRTGGAGCVL